MVKHYASVLLQLKQKQINKCLDILCFSMGNTIVSFQNKYYEYGVDSDPDRHGLTIGGFKSAFLANLEATYIFDKLNMLLTQHVRFIGTYQDDKIIIFWSQRTTRWLTQWLNIFQRKVDDLLRTKDIQFTMEIWSPGEYSGPLKYQNFCAWNWGIPHCHSEWKLILSIPGYLTFLEQER
jgi:hypothetical protein